jgi:DNA-binding PadR family transcriptional regulator
MTKITQSQVRLLKKLADDDETGVVKLLASPDVGDFQAFVLATVGRLSPDATTTAILTYIVEVTQEAPDVAQTYSALERMMKAGFVEKGGTPHKEPGKKPSARYAITAKGRLALAAKRVHMLHLIAFIENASGPAGEQGKDE